MISKDEEVAKFPGMRSPNAHLTDELHPALA